MAGLSVVIPALNEAGTLPLLLADLATWPGDLEILVVDGGSGDATAAVTRIGGAGLLRSPVAGRGQQLRWGAAQAHGALAAGAACRQPSAHGLGRRRHSGAGTS
ncbi:MAG: glycosyltransferase [Parasynechococcus sp.]|uniref:glycosyltransferase n=1 Tax=Parasynechococcus sp. TaxID=3101203 RepID=UPI00388A2BF2